MQVVMPIAVSGNFVWLQEGYFLSLHEQWPNIDANTSPWVKAALVMPRRPRCWSITDLSPLRLKMLRMEKSPLHPERVDVVRFKLYLRHVRTRLYS